MPAYPLRVARFGIPALASATLLGKSLFHGDPARALLAGSAAHINIPPSQSLTGAFGMLSSALGMTRGWSVVVGGTQAITDSLVSAAPHHGVRIHLNAGVAHMRMLSTHDAAIFTLTPRQILKIPGVNLSPNTHTRFERWRYGAAVFKVDYLLSEPVRWADSRVGRTTSVHVGGTAAEIDHAKKQSRAGKLPDKPFVMVCQQQVADPHGLSPATFCGPTRMFRTAI